MSKLVGGWGVNDSSEPIGSRSSGTFKIVCPYYVRWAAMINRAHNPVYQEVQKTYQGVIICEEWRFFSNFKAWMEQQDWEDYQLEKDILGDGKLYSPETCCFVPQRFNALLTQRGNARGDYPLGVHYNKARKPYKATCHDGTGHVYLGRFCCPYEAHKAWQQKKISVIRHSVRDWMESSRPPHRQEIPEALLSKASKIESDLLTGKVTENF